MDTFSSDGGHTDGLNVQNKRVWLLFYVSEFTSSKFNAFYKFLQLIPWQSFQNFGKRSTYHRLRYDNNSQIRAEGNGDMEI